MCLSAKASEKILILRLNEALFFGSNPNIIAIQIIRYEKRNKKKNDFIHYKRSSLVIMQILFH